MSIDHLPDLNPPAFGDIVDPDRPILSFAWRADAAHRVASHSHTRAHIIQPFSGALRAATPQGSWLVPAGQALWIAPRIHHEVYAPGAVAARMIFVDQAYADPLPSRCGTVTVSSLLTELIVRALGYGNEYAPNGPAARLAQVLLDELARLELAPLLLPTADDPRLTQVMNAFAANPDVGASLEAVAAQAGTSPRTLARLFRRETAMTFTQWKTRRLLVEATERLAQGASVTEVALDLGYSTTSSFVHMFRSNMGVPPGYYRARKGK